MHTGCLQVKKRMLRFCVKIQQGKERRGWEGKEEGQEKARAELNGDW